MSDAPSQSGKISVPVEVNIGGRNYRLRGTDPEQLRKLARQVDRTLEEIAGPADTQESFKVAVLAALNLAAEHDEQQQEWAAQLDQIRSRARAVELRLEEIRQEVVDADIHSD